MQLIHNSEGDLAASLQPFVGAVPGHQNQPDKPYDLQILSKQRIPF